MSDDFAIYWSKTMLYKALFIASPVIFAALLCGLLLSILQVVTQIQDSSLNSAPKLLVVVLMLMFSGSWMLQNLIDFSKSVFLSIPKVLE